MKTIEDILDKKTKPWILLGDRNELSSSNEKLFFGKGNSVRHDNINNFINYNNFLI